MGSLGIWGNPGIFYRSCWLLLLLSGSTLAPHTPPPHPAHFTTLCVHDLNIGSVLYILEYVLTYAPPSDSHGSTGLFSIFAAFGKCSLPSQASARSRHLQSTLPKAQATCFGAQLPGIHSISEQGASPSLWLQGLSLPTGACLGAKRPCKHNKLISQSRGTLQPCRHPRVGGRDHRTVQPTRLNWNCSTRTQEL